MGLFNSGKLLDEISQLKQQNVNLSSKIESLERTLSQQNLILEKLILSQMETASSE